MGALLSRVTDQAVILAAGQGTRMRSADSRAELSAAQQTMAARGIKGMIPVGRPFLDYVLSGLADAGCRRVCLVIGPAHPEIREYYTGTGSPTRLAVEFATQAAPRGTADAVLAAEHFAGGEPVLVLNADNLYPRSALESLRGLPRAGLVAFRRSTLLRSGNIPAARIAAFALLSTNPRGELADLVEKPTLEQARRFGQDPLVSMNAWLLPPSIYAACRAIRPSPRGELELQDAVRFAMEQLSETFLVRESLEDVLDLSSPRDIADVTRRLSQIAPRP